MPTQEDDQTYAKTSLEPMRKIKPSVQRVLGVEWNTNSDEFLFDISELASIMEGLRVCLAEVSLRPHCQIFVSDNLVHSRP